jgi:hypothetical protein
MIHLLANREANHMGNGVGRVIWVYIEFTEAMGRLSVADNRHTIMRCIVHFFVSDNGNV